MHLLMRRQQQAVEGVEVNLDSLTNREREILMPLAEGLSNKAIAARFYLSVHTVEGHQARLYTELDVHTRTEAAPIGLRSIS